MSPSPAPTYSDIAKAYDIEPRRVVTFEAPQGWADYLWYVLTLPSACELEDMARKMRAQVRWRNSYVKRRNREQNPCATGPERPPAAR